MTGTSQSEWFHFLNRFDYRQNPSYYSNAKWRMWRHCYRSGPSRFLELKELNPDWIEPDGKKSKRLLISSVLVPLGAYYCCRWKELFFLNCRCTNKILNKRAMLPGKVPLILSLRS